MKNEIPRYLLTVLSFHFNECLKITKMISDSEEFDLSTLEELTFDFMSVNITTAQEYISHLISQKDDLKNETDN